VIARACALATLLWLSGAHAQAPDAEPVRVIEQAEFAAETSPAPAPPGPSADWQPVSLPDNWYFTRPDLRTAGWYRLRFTLETPPMRPLGLFLPKQMATRINIVVNGQRFGGTGSSPDPRVRLVQVPHAFSVPPGMLRQGENVVLLRVEGDPAFKAGLTRVHFGSADVIRDLYVQRFRQQVLSFVVSGFIALFVGLLAAWAWRVDRTAPSPERSATGWLALSAILLGVPAAINVTIGFGELSPLREALHVLYRYAYAPALAIALLRLGQIRVAWLDAGLVAPVLVCAILPLAMGTGILPKLSLPLSAFYIIVWLVIGGVALAKPHLERAMKALLALAVIAVALLAGHDLALNLGWIDYDAVNTLPLAAPALVLALGALLARAYARHAAAANTRREELEAKVLARTREIEAAHAELREITRREAVLKERARIMSDMHDGLGGSLVSALSLVQSGNAAPREIEQRLHDLLTELRLTVDSLSLPEGDLVSVLASVRYRLREALELSGSVLRWEIGAIPVLPGLSPQKLREVQLFAMEALTNALRHARATTITVSGRVTDGTVEIAFADDGAGIPPDDDAQGKGLPSLARRAAAIGGALEIDSRSGNGTTVRLRLPLPG
jgi:signal transduction histidine kinase